MNISRINLNLLVALDALLTERNVTRAGQKLFITQSAMSNVLKQLREVFQDELLVQTGRTMQLTHRAFELQPQIKLWLAQAETIFKPQKFDPKTSQRKFLLGMEEYTNFVLLPELYAYLAQQAPHIELHIKPIPSLENNRLLESPDIELAIGLLPTPDRTIHHELLFKERTVCLARKNHPLFKKKLTLKNYLAANHVALTGNQTLSSDLIDETLAKLGHQRHVVLSLSHIVPAMYAVEKSNLIATVVEGVAKEAVRLLNLSIQPCPFPMPHLSFLQAWHPWVDKDSGYQWLRNVVKTIAQGSGK